MKKLSVMKRAVQNWRAKKIRMDKARETQRGKFNDYFDNHWAAAIEESNRIFAEGVAYSTNKGESPPSSPCGLEEDHY